MPVDMSLTFDGSNWEDLDRIVAKAGLQVVLDQADDDKRPALMAAYAAQLLAGAALDWYVANSLKPAATRADVSTADKLRTQLKSHFGITTELLTTYHRHQLDQLKWDPVDIHTFFADFERHTAQLGMLGDSSKIMSLKPKLPEAVQRLVADWGLSGITYANMRERLMATMLQGGTGTKGPPMVRRVKCSHCGKRGHRAQECRNPKK